MARLQIFLLFVIIATVSVMEARVMEPEVRTCYKKSTTFQGKCTDNKACSIACDYEYWQGGYCQDINTCICTVPCLNSHRHESSAEKATANVFSDVPQHV